MLPDNGFFYIYFLINFINFFAFRISVKWEYRRKAVVASSIINAQEEEARELVHSFISKCFVKELKEKTKLKALRLFF